MTSLDMPIPRSTVSKDRRLLFVVGALYVAQGLPIGLAFQAFPLLLRNAGVSLDMIALVPLASLSWALKLLWSPLVENNWSASIGRRRSWILPMQLVVTLCIASMAAVPFATSAAALIVLVAVAAAASATQDIATDGLAAERLHERSIGRVNATQVGGFMIGMLAGGPGVLAIAQAVGAQVALLALATLSILCSLPVIFWREDGVDRLTPHASLRRFIRRPAAATMMLATVAVALPGSAMFTLAPLLLTDAKWPAAEVGFLTGAGYSTTIIGGGALAAALFQRASHRIVLATGLGILLAGGGLWLLVAHDPLVASHSLVWVCVVLSGVGAGVATVAIYTLLMRYAQLGDQPATDFAVPRSAQTLGEIVIATVATSVAARFGYLEHRTFNPTHTQLWRGSSSIRAG